MTHEAVLHWTLYASAILIICGLISIFAPLDDEPESLQMRFSGTILLAFGFLVFLVGLVLTKGF